jgi:hypothetical protein
MVASGELHALAASLPGKSPQYPFYRRLSDPRSRHGSCGVQKHRDRGEMQTKYFSENLNGEGIRRRKSEEILK